MGSGTTAAVAEKLGRKWICSDLQIFYSYVSKTSYRRQRELKKEAKTIALLRFLILANMRENSLFQDSQNLMKRQTIENNRELAFNSLTFNVSSGTVSGFRTFRGKRNNQTLIGPVNMPVSRLCRAGCCRNVERASPRQTYLRLSLKWTFPEHSG